ncbi:hypothetical protein [Aurantivibrio plasticivorans]
MAIPDADKPLETLREESIDQLIMNYGHGRLSRFAFEERLDKAISAHEHQQPIEISEDLELEVDEKFIQVKRAEMGSRYASAPRASKETFFNIFLGYDANRKLEGTQNNLYD